MSRRETTSTRLLHNIPVIVQFSSVIHAERLSRMPQQTLSTIFRKRMGPGICSCCVSFPKSLIFRQKSELFFCKQPKHILMHLPPFSFYHDIHSDSTQPFSYVQCTQVEEWQVSWAFFRFMMLALWRRVAYASYVFQKVNNFDILLS